MNASITLVQACLLGAAFLVALFYFGFGVTRFLLPPALREWRALTTPFVGLALIVVWDYLALFLGIDLTVATLLLLVISTAVNGAAVLRSLRSSSPSPTGQEILSNRAPLRVGRAGWALFAIALVPFLAAIAPLVRYGYITIIGENWDYEFYLPLADALRMMPTAAFAQAPSNPLMSVILSRHIWPLPMGFSYLQSSLDVLFRLEAFDSFAVLLAVVRALGVVSAFVFFRATLKMSPRAALAASGLLGVNGLLLWATYWNFGLHLTSLALLPIALTFGVETFFALPGRNGIRDETWRSGVHPLPIAALFLAALNVTFHPTLIVALLPLAGIGLYVLITRRERVRTLTVGAGLILLAAALSFPTLFHVQDFLREYYGREPLATGLREFIPLTDAYGLSQYSLELVVGHTIPTPALYDLATRIWGIAAPVLLTIAVAASILALWQLRRIPPAPLVSSEPRSMGRGPGNSTFGPYARRAVWYTVAAASVFYVAVFRLPFLHAYPYGFLKSLTLVSFVLIALVVEGIANFELRIANYELRIVGTDWRSRALQVSRYAFLVLLVPFALLSLFTCAITLEQYFKPAPPFFNADDLKLRAVTQVLPRGATVFLTDRGEVQKIPMGLAAYALREYPLYGKVSTGYGDMDNAMVGAVYDYALLARGEDPAGRGYQATPLWANDKFALYAKAPEVAYHRTVNARVIAPDPLTLTLGANEVVSGTQTVSPTVSTRGVNIALASFVPQTLTLTLGGTAQSVTLVPGLSVFRIPQAQLPGSLTISPELASESGGATPLPIPGELPRTDPTLFVPWVELLEGGGAGEQSLAPTKELLVRCTSAAAKGLNTRCFVANPGGVTLRWEYVVRGTPAGTREDQELVRRATEGSPRQMLDIATGASSGQLDLGFDGRAPAGFSIPVLKDGSYRGALEIFRPAPAAGGGDILVAQIDLYRFAVAKNGGSFTRTSPLDPPLVVVEP